MDFFKLIQSLDELLYEIMSWLIFYPVTLWRAITRPLQMMDYADAELSDTAEKQYTDTLSPPLFLLLTLVVIQAVELSLVGENKIVKSNVGLDAFISNDTNLLVLRLITFSLFPLIMATRLVRRQKVGLERDTLRSPFFSQCYVTGVFALGFSGGGILIRQTKFPALEEGAILSLVALLWFGTLQAIWFARHLKTSRLRGFWNASIGMVESIAATAVLGWLFAT